MEHLKKEEKRRNPLLIPVILLSIAVVMLAILLLWTREKSEKDDQQQSSENTSVSTETQIPDVGIETPYGTLYYPGEWEGNMRIENVEKDSSYSVNFYGNVNEREELLYTVWFGESGENAFPVGTIKVNGQEISVSMEMSDFVPDESWSTDDSDKICAMQETLNDVLEKIQKLPDFVAI